MFNKIRRLSNTLDAIESWLDTRSPDSNQLLTPRGFLTLENLDAHIIAETESLDLKPAL